MGCIHVCDGEHTARVCPVKKGSSARLPKHADEHRPESPILLAVDQRLRKRPRLGVPVELADLSCAPGVGKRQDVEEGGAAGGTDGV